eukprot:1914902-Prymnesium_polylepis.1
MMYNGMSVFLATSVDMSRTATIGRGDEDRRVTYSSEATLSEESPLVLGWVMVDAASGAQERIAAYTTPSAAKAALAARSAAANRFLTTEVPQLNVTLLPTAAGEPALASSAGAEWDGTFTRTPRATTGTGKSTSCTTWRRYTTGAWRVT